MAAVPRQRLCDATLGPIVCFNSLRPFLLLAALTGHCLGSDLKAPLIPSSGVFLFGVLLRPDPADSTRQILPQIESIPEPLPLTH
jgi:hypothetical protein